MPEDNSADLDSIEALVGKTDAKEEETPTVADDEGKDTLTDGEGGDTVAAGDGDDTVTGGVGGDTVAGDGAADTLAGGGAKEVQVDPAEQERQRKDAEDEAKLLEDWGGIDKKMTANETDDLDVIDDTPQTLRTMHKMIKLQQKKITTLEAGEQSKNASKANDQFWTTWAENNPEVGADGRTWFDDEYTKAKKRYNNDLNAARVAATERFNIRVEQAKAAGDTDQTEEKETTTPAPTARAANNPSNQQAPRPDAGRIVPRTTTNRIPAKPMSSDDKLEQGVYGNLAKIV